MDYRKKQDFKVIKLPTLPPKEDRGGIECCCDYKVFADLTSNDTWKNDVKLVWFKKSNASDTVAWTISKCGTGVVANLGTTLTTPNEPLGTGFIFDWNLYLAAHGVGKYTIEVTFTISGVSGGYVVGNYDLSSYAPDKVDGTIRLKAKYNSFDLEENFDFTNSNAVDTLRVPGFFGYRDLNTQINNHVDINRTVVKSSREYLTMFEMEAEPLTTCESVPLRFMLLNEDLIYLSDFNSCNHEQLFDVPVVVEILGKPEYMLHTRLMKLICTFGQRVKNEKVFYNV